MKVVDLYSKRKRRKENHGKEDVYQYHWLPKELKRQIIFIWQDAIGPYYEPRHSFDDHSSPSNGYWDYIESTLLREYGEFKLARGGDPFSRCMNFLLDAGIERALDIIEFSFCIIEELIPNSNDYNLKNTINLNAEKAIEELNHRFKESGAGYEYINGEIIQINSKFIHSEITVPAIKLLYNEGFEGASEEFMTAHKHFRNKEYKEAINNALKSIESVIKTICNKKNWAYNKNAPVKQLIKIIFDNNFISRSLETKFSGIRTTLEAGLPTVRNKNSGHGQGEEKVAVSKELAHYALNLAATNIVFLVETFQSSS